MRAELGRMQGRVTREQPVSEQRLPYTQQGVHTGWWMTYWKGRCDPPPQLPGEPPRVVLQKEFQQLERERLFFFGRNGVMVSRVYPQCDSSSLGCSLTFCGDTNPVEVSG